jgi:septum formation protein
MNGSALIYLASASARRQTLLEQIGVGFEQLHVRVDEQSRAGELADAYVQRLALAKARAGRAFLDTLDPRPVLGADTAVAVDNRIMGKPHDRAQGLEMLRALSGRDHEVLSAVALAGGHEALRLSRSRVSFRVLEEAECEAYWETGEPLDKAGGYAIQGHAAQFIERLEGSYSGVMGLPLFETAQLLKEFFIKIL